MTADFERTLASILVARIDGCRGLVVVRAPVRRRQPGDLPHRHRTDEGERKLALRRAPGGYRAEARRLSGPRTEAELMRAARAAGVPEPEVHCVLTPRGRSRRRLPHGVARRRDAGRAHRARSLRSPRSGRSSREQCGEILARIHAIDLEATGLERLL